MKPEPLKNKLIQLKPKDLGIKKNHILLSVKDGTADIIELKNIVKLTREDDIKSAVEWLKSSLKDICFDDKMGNYTYKTLRYDNTIQIIDKAFEDVTK